MCGQPAHYVSSLRPAANSPSQCRTNTTNDLGGPVSSHHSDDDPSKALEHFQSPDVPGVLATIAPMLFAVIFDRYFDVLPAHVEICNCIAKFVEYRNLSLRPRKATPMTH